MSNLAIVIMAAGKGTRMKSQLPKVLHPLVGRPMLSHVVSTAQTLEPKRLIVLVGHQADLVKSTLQGLPVEWAIQEPQLGTGHAVAQAAPHLDTFSGDVVVLSGDVPRLQAETLRQLVDAHREANAAATVLTMQLDNPKGYGRIIRNDHGSLSSIVEEKDATPEQRKIHEVNSGTYCFNWSKLAPLLNQLSSNNAQGEYYLTDALGMLVQAGEKVALQQIENPSEVQGINDRVELSQAEADLRQRINTNWMREGVTLIDPAQTYIDWDVKIGADTVIAPGCTLHGNTVIGSNCQIGPNCRLINAQVGDEVTIISSEINDSQIGAGTTVGPYAHIRGHSVVGNASRIGNFVELKNAQLSDGVKSAHLAYLGDLSIGTDSNIGAGTIICNYDGYRKYRSEIGARVFVGSNSVIVSPLKLENDSFVAAGSVITKDVQSGALAIARGQQRNIEGWVWERQKRENGCD